jgi:polar amino acid transport system substrate-binding protein
MRLTYPLLLAACLLLPGGAALAAGPLQILAEDAASPWSNRDGSGYANDLVRAAFAAAGVAVDLAVVPYARCKALVKQGGAVACLSMSEDPDVGKLVLFSDKPLFSVTPRFYYNTRGAAPVMSVEQLTAGTRVGIVHGYEYPPLVAQLAARGILFESARSDVANLRKLAAGRLDFALVMTDEMRSEELIQRQAGVRNIGFAFQSTPMGSYIGFSALHPDGDAQRRNFNAGFQAIHDNGVRKAVQARWKLRCATFCPE